MTWHDPPPSNSERSSLKTSGILLLGSGWPNYVIVFLHQSATKSSDIQQSFQTKNRDSYYNFASFPTFTEHIVRFPTLVYRGAFPTGGSSWSLECLPACRPWWKSCCAKWIPKPCWSQQQISLGSFQAECTTPTTFIPLQIHKGSL